MPLPRRPLLAAALCAASFHVSATTWLCGLSEDAASLVCIADVDRIAASVPPDQTSAIRGTAFPLDPGRVWTVDLWSPPTEASFVAQLAEATICYRSPDCRVVMSRLPMSAPATFAKR